MHISTYVHEYFFYVSSSMSIASIRPNTYLHARTLPSYIRIYTDVAGSRLEPIDHHPTVSPLAMAALLHRSVDWTTVLHCCHCSRYTRPACYGCQTLHLAQPGWLELWLQVVLLLPLSCHTAYIRTYIRTYRQAGCDLISADARMFGVGYWLWRFYF